MQDIIFINNDLNLCELIKSNHENNAIGHIEKLINADNREKKFLFILSSQIAFSSKLQFPKKNKSVFKSNAKQIIKQNQNIKDEKNIIIQKQNAKFLPYIIIDHKKLLEINEILKKNHLDKSNIILEKNIFINENKNWHILIKLNGQIFIHHKQIITETNRDNLLMTIKVIIEQEEEPKKINWYSMNKTFDLSKVIKEVEKIDPILKKISHDEKTLFLEILNENKSKLKLSDLLFSDNIYLKLIKNSKSINLFILSFIIFITFIFEYSSNRSFQNELEIRKKNTLDFIFSEFLNDPSEQDLLTIEKRILSSSHLPEYNHIDSLNIIGLILNIPGININKIEIENEIITTMLTAKSNEVISNLNDRLQDNEYLDYEIKSIDNKDNKSLINLVLKLGKPD